MKYQSFIMRILCLILIIGAVIGYNSMQKDNSDAELTQEISSLTKRVETLEEQQEEILSALEDAAKAQEEAKKKAEEEAQKADKDEESSTADEKENAREDEKTRDAGDVEDSDPAEEAEDLVYKNGTYTGEGQGFGGTIQVQVTLEEDTITDIQVVSAKGEDSAYLSQGEGVISSILSAQSTDVDTISGATFSSTGIINAVIDALGKAENE